MNIGNGYSGVFQDDVSDLQQLQVYRRLATRQFHAYEGQTTDDFHQQREQQVELVGPPAMRIGAIRKQTQVLLLDTILHFTT